MSTDTLLPPEIVERTRAILRRLLGDGWTQTEIARRLKISQAAISNALNPRKSGGLKPQNAIAIYQLAGEDTAEISRALTGHNRSKGLASARNAPLSSGVPGGSAGVKLGKLVQLQAALQSARYPGLEVCLLNHPPATWSDATIAACRHGAWEDDVEPWEWPARLNRFQTLMGGVTVGPHSSSPAPRRMKEKES